jgi:hypothetical protein
MTVPKAAGSHLKIVGLLSLGVAGPILAVPCLRALTGTISPPKAKLLLLLTEYLWLLPIIVWLLWTQRGGAAGDAMPRRSAISVWLVMAMYLLFLIPVAGILDPGIYQSDEGVYRFQAWCLRAGELSVRPPSSIPPLAVQFHNHVVSDGKLYGKYPFGWPAILLIGTVTNLEWLINPLLGLLLIWITYKVGAELLPPEERGYDAVLITFSAFFTLNCLGFMSQVLCAVLLAGATLCYLRYSASKRFSWLIGMLACVSASVLVRPFTAFCIGIVLVIWSVWSLRRETRALLLFLVCGAVLGGSAVGIWAVENHELTGSYLRTPYSVYTQASPIRDVSFLPADLIQNLTHITPIRIADTLSVAFPFIFLLAAYGLWRGRRDQRLWLLAALMVSLVAGHVVQMFDSDSPIGERYYFEAYFAVAVLAGAGWARLIQDCRWSVWSSRALGIALCLVAAGQTAVCTAWETHLRWPPRQITKASDHPPFQRGVVFLIAGDRFLPQDCNVNRPNGEVLYLVDAGVPDRKELAERLGYKNWATLRYDDTEKMARWELYTSDSATGNTYKQP